MPEERSILLRMRGRVQGVGFRPTAFRLAHELGLRGWVRNRRDGSVEAMVAGPPESVQRLLDWSRHGPPAAIVHSVDSFAAEGRFNSFEQWPTY